MCVICKMGEIVNQLERLIVRETKNNEKGRAAQALASTFLVQAAQASLAGEWGIIGSLVAKAQESIDLALEQTQCNECGNPDCPRDHHCEDEDSAN